MPSPTQHPKGPSGLANEVRDLLERLLAEQGLSVRELGRRAGLDDSSIFRILHSQQIPTVDLVDRVFAGFGLEVAITVTPNEYLERVALDRSSREP